MTNTTTVIEMVIAAGVQSAMEIEAHITAQGKAITIPMLNDALNELAVAHTTKMTKATKINLLARAMEMDMVTCIVCRAPFVTDVPDTTGNEVCQTCHTQAAQERSAAVETTVAEEIKPVEVVVMEEIKLAEVVVAGGLTKKQKEANLRMLDKSAMTKGDKLFMTQSHGYENPNLVDMLNKVEAAKNTYIKNVGENAVQVLGIVFYPEKKDASREELRNRKYVHTDKFGRTFLGELTFQMPRDYAQIKVWNPNLPNSKGKLGAPEFVPFHDVNLDLVKRPYNMRRPLSDGSGLVVLPIKEGKDGKPYVNLPVEVDRNVKGKFYEIFRTSDARFVKTKDLAIDPDTKVPMADQPLFLSDNNTTLNAQLTAFIQVMTGEFTEELPENRHGFKESCDTCSNCVRLQTRDGVTDDIVTESKKSRAVLESPDVMQLAQVGPFQPSRLCMVREEIMDIELVRTLNEATTFERTEYYDEEGALRYQTPNQVKIAGKVYSVAELTEKTLGTIATNCRNYLGNSAKSEHQLGKEKTELREKLGVNGDTSVYINPFYRQRAKVGRQMIQTLVEVDGQEAWVNQYPGEVEAPYAFRVKGAGVTVYGTDEVMSVVDPTFIAKTEEFDARHADVMKKINQMFYAAFNLDKLDEKQAEMVFALADNKPADLTDAESVKWDKAVFWLGESIGWAMDREEVRKQSLFPQKFFAGVKEGTTELHVELVMGEKMNRQTIFKSMEEITGDAGADKDKKYNANRNDFIHDVYDDLEASEFVRYLDDAALDYVYEAIVEGTDFSLVGGTDADKTLAAAALQSMLQTEVNYTFVRGVRRDVDAAAAIEALKVCDATKAYIAMVVKLTK